MDNEERDCRLLGFIADIRAATGDNGRRMQPEFLEFCRELVADREMLDWCLPILFGDVTGDRRALLVCAQIVVGKTGREAIQAAINQEKEGK